MRPDRGHTRSPSWRARADSRASSAAGVVPNPPCWRKRDVSTAKASDAIVSRELIERNMRKIRTWEDLERVQKEIVEREPELGRHVRMLVNAAVARFARNNRRLTKVQEAGIESEVSYAIAVVYLILSEAYRALLSGGALDPGS